MIYQSINPVKLYGFLLARRIANTTYALPAPAPHREPKDTPPPMTLAEPPRFVMILSGHWHRMRVVNYTTNKRVFCVDTGYGVRWFRRTQLVQWALMYAGTQRKETRHVLAA